MSRGREWALQQAEVEPERGDGDPRRYLTDLGNAERFVDAHGEGVRYCHQWGKWLVFDGRRWGPDDEGLVEAMMKATVRNIYREAADAADDKERKAIADHAKRSEAKKRITDALYLARSEPGIPVSPADLDADPWLLNVENGTIDLRTGELREHRREDLITKLAPVKYDKDAEAPIFAGFLERILPSEALRRFVQRVVGYAATGTVSEEILVILHGVGANGKTTHVNSVMGALGDYAMQAAPDLLMVKRGSHPTELADLFGARFVASVEVDEGRRLAESLVKQITGRDPIKARRMREDFWQFDPTHTVFLATNHKPEVRGTDHAIWRRIRLVPFTETIPPAEQDKKLPERLRAERPGILTWIVQGCLDWQREGLGEPEEVKAATEGYRADMDVLAGFISDRCVVHDSVTAGATPLYNAYKEWCEDNGERQEAQNKFAQRLRERGFVRDRETTGANRGRYIWRGLGLISDHEPPDGPDKQAMREPPDAKGSQQESRMETPKTADRQSMREPGEPKFDINSKKSLHEASMPKSGSRGFTGSLNSERRRTPEEDRAFQRLVKSGVAQHIADAMVRGEDVDIP